MHYHMLLVCDILSSSTPHPEVNHGRASLPTFSLHTRLDSLTYAHKLIHSINAAHSQPIGETYAELYIFRIVVDHRNNIVHGTKRTDIQSTVI